MRQYLSDYALFLREFRRTFHTTGAILPSSPRLGRTLARFVAADSRPAGSGSATEASPAPRRILEVGPGTGAVTAHIVARLGPDDWLELVELNERFVARLRDRFADDPRLAPVASRTTIHHAPVQDLPGVGVYDVIVSGLPLNNFSVELVESIVAAFGRLVKPGGTLSFFEYIGVRPLRASIAAQAERQRLRGLSRVLGELLSRHEFRRESVLANLPPAWVHHLRWKSSAAPTQAGDPGNVPSESLDSGG